MEAPRVTPERLLADLNALATELHPFGLQLLPGSRLWNGTAYVESSPREPDPWALSWASCLTTASGLLEGQEAPLSAAQLEYLREMLFGGMGSLIDFQLDEQQHGEPARLANERMRSILHNAFTYLGKKQKTSK